MKTLISILVALALLAGCAHQNPANALQEPAIDTLDFSLTTTLGFPGDTVRAAGAVFTGDGAGPWIGACNGYTLHEGSPDSATVTGRQACMLGSTWFTRTNQAIYANLQILQLNRFEDSTGSRVLVTAKITLYP